jgi:hypothetical protein
MAIYHLSAKIIGRSDGRSAVAAAAYRSGERLRDERTGRAHRYGQASRVAHAEILAPAGSPAWTRDRGSLWNRVEAGENRKDAQLSREFELGLPVELDREAQLALLRGWVEVELHPHGIVADVCLHDSGDGNPHAHIMTTMRAVDADGDSWGPKLRSLNRGGGNAALLAWREAWADHVNDALERHGSTERVDHRSHADRGLDQMPTIKIGPVLGPDRLAINDRVREFNDIIRKRARKAIARTAAAAISLARAVEAIPFTRAKGPNDAATSANRVKLEPGPLHAPAERDEGIDPATLAAWRDRDRGR